MDNVAVLRTEPARRRRVERARPQVEVIAHDRAYEAHQLWLGGLDWTEIVTQTGYLNGRIASMAVNAYLQKAAVEQAPDRRGQGLDLELARLDALQAAYWPAAMAGDLLAAAFILKIVDRRCLILGLDRVEIETTATEHTVAIVRGTSEQYIGALQAVVAGQVMDVAL